MVHSGKVWGVNYMWKAPYLKSAIQEVAALFFSILIMSLLAAFNAESAVELQLTEIAQPLLFA